MMVRRIGKLVVPVVAFVLLLMNIGVYRAHAHNWGSYHWDKGGSAIYIDEWNYANQGNDWADAERARQDKWNNIPILYNYSVNYHTDVSVFDGNYGATGWAGLATLESLNWDWGCWCVDHIGHGHARYNTYYGGSDWDIQGVYCQEVYHTYGVGHGDHSVVTG